MTFQAEANRCMIFTGCGDAIEKTISCVEITKTKFKVTIIIFYFVLSIYPYTQMQCMELFAKS